MQRLSTYLPVLLALLLSTSEALSQEYDPRRSPKPFARSAHSKLGCLACHVPRMPTPAEYEELPKYESHFPLDPTAALACIECHEEEGREYRRGLHYRGLVAGKLEAPHCVDCHAPARRRAAEGGALADQLLSQRGNPHAIANTTKEHPAIPGDRVDQMCARCHANQELATKYGFSADAVPTYEDSIHGRRAYLGSDQVPNCASCHRSHGSLKPSDPDSPVHPRNVQATCARCHRGASESFAMTFRHERLSQEKDPALYWLEKGYVLLIVLVVGFLYAHVVLDVFNVPRQRLADRLSAHVPLPPGTPGEIERMNLNLRFQHIAMFLSTITLVITGWPLKVYNAPLSRTVEDLFGGVDTARLVHRGAALVLVATFVWHLGYVVVRIVRRRARFDILPVPRDLVHVVQQFAYYLGIRDTRPHYGKFSYSQKVEYLAVVWGTLVMAVSGAVLWSSEFVQHLPGWVHKAASIVHGYEALLAAIAVFGFHFYNEHLRYQVFPMSRIWITGKAKAREYREEWPADFERRFGTDEPQEREKEKEK